MDKLKKKSVYLTKVCGVLLTEEMDNIKNTTAYKQKIKNLTNTLAEELEKEYAHTYSVLQDEGSQKGLFYVANAIEGFCEALSSCQSGDEMLDIVEAINSINKKQFKFAK